MSERPKLRTVQVGDIFEVVRGEKWGVVKGARRATWNGTIGIVIAADRESCTFSFITTPMYHCNTWRIGKKSLDDLKFLCHAEGIT